MTAWIQDTLIPLLDNIGVDGSRISIEGLKSMLVQNWAKAGGLANWVFATMLQSGFRMMEWLLNLILVPVVTFYLLCDWDRFISGLRSLLPRRIEPTIVKLLKECDEVLGAFLRGQLLVMLALAVIYSIGLTLVGLKTGILIGAIAGLLSIVPYLGFIVGIIIASVVAFMQFGGFTVLLVWVVFVGGNVIDNLFLTPKLVGNRIGLHPVAVIFAILAGGELFGFLGVLLALPAAASIMVWIRYLNQQYHKSELYKS
jgi:predicted PurR-regulated permease PerM